MLQYLLNMTAIWLISLLMFDLFLRTESYHNYNRFYLLSTFLLGALLPLWQWEGGAVITKGTLQQPVEKVIAAKQTIIAAATPHSAVDWALWLGVAYAAGMLVAIVALLIDVSKMAVLYHSGKRSKQDGWTIVETGREHAPFSFLNILFVPSRQQYSADEWNMVLVHERRHKTLLHVADLLLMQVGRVIFWFHPLVYIYNNRLLLIHEYQADSAASEQPALYGSFLLEQALFGPAPNLSHSLNRSPIKKRILMLTHRSSVLARSKMLVFVPLALVCFLCFTKNSFSQKQQNQYGKILPVITLGDIEANTQLTTRNKILSNPKLICNDGNSTITGFQTSFSLRNDNNQRDEVFMGPIDSKGAELPEKIISLIKKNNGNITKATIYIENIHVISGGRDMKVNPIVLSYNQ